MNTHNNLNEPPDIAPVTPEQVKLWELGQLNLSPEQLYGALALTRTLQAQGQSMLVAV